MAVGVYRSPVERLSRAVAWIVTGLVLFYLIAPLLAVIPLSFTSSTELSYPIPHFSLRWFEEFWQSKDWTDSLRNSLVIGLATSVISTVLGTLAALGLMQEGFPLKPFVMGFLLAPLIVPVITFAVGIYFFLAPIGLTDSYFGIILAHVTLAIPLVVVAVSATLSGFDRNLLRAASSLGANPVRAFFKVILPLVLPGVITGALFAFSTSLDEVVTVLFLAGPEQTTLPKQMFTGIRYGLHPTIIVSASMLMVVSVLLLGATAILRRRAERLRSQA